MRESAAKPAPSAAISWTDAQPLFAAPCFDVLRTHLEQLDAAHWPSVAALNKLADARGLKNLAGMPVRFVAPAEDEPAALHYETRIAHSGEVATREIWHDLFNGLQWLSFPQTKAVISARHAQLLATRGEHESKLRSVPRDVLTLFDEGGIIICSPDDSLLELVRNFKWRELFVERRAEVMANMRFHLAGHSVLEKMLAPFIGITAKAMLFKVDAPMMTQSVATQIAHLDAHAAQWLYGDINLAATRNLHPVPILGVPGWDARNDDAAFYGDTHYFRSGYTRDLKR